MERPQPQAANKNKNVAQHPAKKVTQNSAKAKAPAASKARLASMPIAEAPKRPLLGWPVLVKASRNDHSPPGNPSSAPSPTAEAAPDPPTGADEVLQGLRELGDA